MDINQENINNLTALWKKYGATVIAQTPESKINASNSWPNRCWIEGENNRQFYLTHAPDTHKIMQWGEIDNGQLNADSDWQQTSEQTAMYLALNDYDGTTLPRNSAHNLIEVTDPETLKTWAKTSGEAFNYEIDLDALIPLLEEDDASLFLGMVEQQPALTAILYRTGDVVGLHQMGVKPGFQGRGLAGIAMQQLLTICQQSGARYMVLQASQAGFPLYEKFGFQQQFKLTYFEKKAE